jgi:phage-related baseplate assembly protein
MSLLERVLPEPDFVSRDPDAITQALIANYEQLTGKTLYPAQVERLLIDVISYRETLIREAIQDAAKLNLIRYSRAPVLDCLGEELAVERLGAKAASTTLRFHFNPVPAQETVFPAGAMAECNNVGFEVTDSLAVPAGSESIDVTAQCTQVGIVGNGFLPGQISTLTKRVDGFEVDAVSNIETSSGGSEAESDDRYRERLILAPEKFSTAGSVGAYKFYALSAHPDIVDIAVVSPQLSVQSGQLASSNSVPPGCVYIYPLMKSGLPSAEIKAAVLNACTAEKVRPCADFVQVFDPVGVDFSITANLILYAGADDYLALQMAQQAAQAYQDRMFLALGKDIVRDELIALLKGYGIYAVGLAEPAQDRELNEWEWPRCIAINISVTGMRRG